MDKGGQGQGRSKGRREKGEQDGEKEGKGGKEKLASVATTFSSGYATGHNDLKIKPVAQNT